MGELVVHNIVSNADTIVVLKNPCIKFAEWGKPAPSTAEEIEEAFWEYSAKKRRKKREKWKKCQEIELVIDEKESIAEIAIPIDDGKSSSNSMVPEESLKSIQQSIFGVKPSKDPEPEASEDDRNTSHPIEINAAKVERVPQTTVQSTEENGIRFRVCAGNLMSASPWFNRVLAKNGWMESNRNLEDKCYYISAEDWDEEAFLILMNIFHLRNREVPRTVTLETLAKIAVLVDYYSTLR